MTWLTVGGTIPGSMVLGCIRKLTKHEVCEPAREQASKLWSSLVPASRFLPWVPALTSLRGKLWPIIVRWDTPLFTPKNKQAHKQKAMLKLLSIHSSDMLKEENWKSKPGNANFIHIPTVGIHLHGQDIFSSYSLFFKKKKKSLQCIQLIAGLRMSPRVDILRHHALQWLAIILLNACAELT